MRNEMTLFYLKIIAYTSMLIDHITIGLYKPYLARTMTAVEIGDYMPYTILRIIGRIAFPIFAFMVAEGMKYTRSRRKYLLRLLVMAIVSEPCYDYLDDGVFWYAGSQNVCIPLLFGAIVICLIDIIKEKINSIPLITIIGSLITIAFSIATYLLKTDYAVYGVLLVVFFGYFYKGLIKDCNYSMIVLAILIFFTYAVRSSIHYANRYPGELTLKIFIKSGLTLQLYEVLVLPLLERYKGKVGPKLHKLVYYSFYPVHMLVIGIIASLIY